MLPKLGSTAAAALYTRMSLYCLELTANSSNVFLLALERVFSFIVKAESSIWGPLKSFSKKYFFVYFWRVYENGDSRQNIKFFVRSQGPQMPLSDLPMKKEIQYGHKILWLNWFVVHLNKYELIPIYVTIILLLLIQ